MIQLDINILLQNQKDFFSTGKTKDVAFRIANLIKLKNLIINNEDKIFEALFLDLHKSKTEAYTSEIAYILNEIDYAIKNIKKWSKPKSVRTSLINQPGKSYIKYEPYGLALIIAPWNYPFGLIFTPLIGAISAGNCAIIKPSEISKHSAELIAKLINDNFPAHYLRVIQGNAEITKSLINENIDYIFFTGSEQVGKIIMSAAGEHLIPITLELGGKNPCIIDKEIDLKVSAKRVVWSKFFNAGQTCIAPDYLLLHRDIQDEFVEILKETIKDLYPQINKDSLDYSHIINANHFNRLITALNEGTIIFGGENDFESLFIAPTLINGVDFNSEIMKTEIFGPILPIITYDNLDFEINRLNKLSKPLALYFFSKNKIKQDKVIAGTSSGMICINGALHVIMSKALPFGGVGNSGMGNYHGFASFETFSHKKSILKKSFKFDLNAIYPPYKTKLSLLKRIVKNLYII